MKFVKITICLLLLLKGMNPFSQKIQPELQIITGIDSFKCLVMDNVSGVDTIHKYAMNAILLDYYIHSSSNVSVILETPLAYLMYNYIKSEGDWKVVMKGSGQVAPNYKLLSYQDPKFINHQPISSSFKFVDSNNVQYQEVNGDIRKLSLNQILNKNRF